MTEYFTKTNVCFGYTFYRLLCALHSVSPVEYSPGLLSLALLLLRVTQTREGDAFALLRAVVAKSSAHSVSALLSLTVEDEATNSALFDAEVRRCCGEHLADHLESLPEGGRRSSVANAFRRWDAPPPWFCAEEETAAASSTHTTSFSDRL